MFFPQDAKDDRLRVELIPPLSIDNDNAHKRPEYAGKVLSKLPKRRRRASEEHPGTMEEDTMDANGWTESTNGKWLTKRVKNQIIRKPVEEIAEMDSSRPSTPETERQ